MTAEMDISAQDRVLVLAPHPDDETLAAGDLIQTTLAAGATLRVVFATDGDNNPWPQRWLERRWRIGAHERARWGARRRGEARAALQQLGVGDAAAARFLGWPDQGLTALLMRDDAPIATLTDEIVRFAPTHLVAPTLADRHPDHSALRVIADLALLRSGLRCSRLGYVVHGEKLHADARLLSVPPRDAQAKQRAMAAHASQLALSRKRLLALAALPNRFEPSAATVPPIGAWSPLRIAYPASSLGRYDLLLLIALRDEVVRISAAAPRRPHTARIVDRLGREYAFEYGARELRIVLPTFDAVPQAVYAKFHRRDPRLLIFDRTFWRHDADLLDTPGAALTEQPDSGYI